MTRTINSIPRELAERIRLVIFDVDGVLTDAGLYTGATAKGELFELKSRPTRPHPLFASFIEAASHHAR